MDRMTAGCMTAGYCDIRFPGFWPGKYCQVNRLTSELLARPAKAQCPGTPSTDLQQSRTYLRIIAQIVLHCKAVSNP